MSPQPSTAPPNSSVSGGEMGKLIRNFDWGSTPIGPMGQWSDSLKNLVSMALVNRFPMLIWWGEHYVQIYNDPYIPVLGMKHPSPGLGHPGYECWKEIWSVIGPLAEAPFRGGPATWMDDILLMVNRNNFVEETHFTISYSPVPDPSTESGIGGVLAIVSEITQEIMAKRQMETLRKLSESLVSTSSVTDVYEEAVNVLQQVNNHDIPCAFIHSIDEKSRAKLIAAAGIDKNHPELIDEIDLSAKNMFWEDWNKAVMEGNLVIGDNLLLKANAPCGAWEIPPRQFAYLPIKEAKRDTPIAIVTLALNPHRQVDELYKNFLQLITDQISAGAISVIAYEKEKQRAESLAELDKAKTTFFGNVSHEFRTPLTLLLGPLDELLSQENDKLIADREIVSLIHRNGLRLQKLVNSLLDFSRIEAGRMQIAFQATDICKLTTDIASNFTSATAKAGLKFEVDCPPIAERVYVDEEMWEKIVLNLLSNAFKFTLNGKISIQLKLSGDNVLLTVADTGVGIAPEDQHKIFERFHRAVNVQSRSFEGSGIGLALVSELVKLHGGTISVESEPGKGTTFQVSIPRGSAHIDPELIVRDAPIKSVSYSKTNVFREEVLRWLPDDIRDSEIKDELSAKPVIVLADDNADMRDYIKKVLSEYCIVHSATNGREAFELTRKIKPDLLLSDIMMPEVDGLQLLQMMRQDPYLKTTPIILLSARAGEEAKVEGFYAGADDYLTKPFTRNELIARVNANIQLSNLRKEIEEAIRQSESRLRALVLATSDVIYRMNTDWTVMHQLDGRNFLQDTGEPLTSWDDKYIHPGDQSRVWKVIREAIRTKSIFHLEHQVIRADGTLGWTLSRAVPILDRQGEIVEWFGAATDISARKLHETELERHVENRTKELNEVNVALQVSNDDLQQFAHVASHDLKEPVRKIKTFTYRLMDGSTHFQSERGKSYLDKILASAERMSTMIDGVLSYSSLNGNNVAVESIDLNKLLEEIKEDLELLIQQSGSKIFYSNLPVITGGRILLYQLFYNLISNSLKFRHPDRAPVIEINWHLDETNRQNKHVISVKDNGIGFEEEFNEAIFKTFSRLNSKDKFDGTGLGLALCRKIVERHHGTIHANGKKNEGAIFTITIPVIESKTRRI